MAEMSSIHSGTSIMMSDDGRPQSPDIPQRVGSGVNANMIKAIMMSDDDRQQYLPDIPQRVGSGVNANSRATRSIGLSHY
ncbi:hypothetical protein JTE90_016717 [Oedothorax gibbosus]|uniref:Uncharacterized protein n=1 Tax=Oedothorax gibbosus TaxID=931172 RepID=A0AAV6V3K6_9ARAC|nr:hypothetical protein JTE90_016717 [Oedothorax gibbosus]